MANAAAIAHGTWIRKGGVKIRDEDPNLAKSATAIRQNRAQAAPFVVRPGSENQQEEEYNE